MLYALCLIGGVIAIAVIGFVISAFLNWWVDR